MKKVPRKKQQTPKSKYDARKSRRSLLFYVAIFVCMLLFESQRFALYFERKSTEIPELAPELISVATTIEQISAYTAIQTSAQFTHTIFTDLANDFTIHTTEQIFPQYYHYLQKQASFFYPENFTTSKFFATRTEQIKDIREKTQDYTTQILSDANYSLSLKERLHTLFENEKKSYISSINDKITPLFHTANACFISLQETCLSLFSPSQSIQTFDQSTTSLEANMRSTTSIPFQENEKATLAENTKIANTLSQNIASETRQVFDSFKENAHDFFYVQTQELSKKTDNAETDNAENIAHSKAHEKQIDTDKQVASTSFENTDQSQVPKNAKNAETLANPIISIASTPTSNATTQAQIQEIQENQALAQNQNSVQKQESIVDKKI